jgi:AcrR family transcriptional regulator
MGGSVARLIGPGGETIEGESTISNISGQMSDTAAARDRRASRTQEAIRSAFNHLVFTRQFDEIRIDDILEAADVARSTFYKHYSGKGELLCSVMEHILEPMARAGSAPVPSPELLAVAEHVSQNRRLAREIFWGSTRTAIVRDLARRVERGMAGIQPESGLPVTYIAGTVAQWQFASLEEWLLGRHRFEPQAWAEALCRGSASLTSALMCIDSA